MKEIFQISTERRKDYGRSKRNKICKFILIVMVIWLVTTITHVSIQTDSDGEIVLVALLSVIFGFGLICGITTIIGAKDMFDFLSVELTESGITRHGELFRETYIGYHEIDSVVVDSTGLLVIRKGFGNRFLFKYLRLFWNTSQSYNLIYIPTKMDQYDRIKEIVLDQFKKTK